MIDWSYISYMQEIGNQIIARGQSVTDFKILAERRLFSEDFIRQNGIFYCDEYDYDFIGGYDNLATSMIRFGGALINCWVYPLKMHNVLVGWCAWDPETGEYTNLFFQGVIKKQVIYGLKPNNYQDELAILVEGITDKLRIDYIGLDYGVGLMGNKITDYSKALFNRIRRKIIIPDRDKTGMDAKEIWERMLEGEKFWIFLDEGAKDIDQRLKERPELVPQFITLVTDIKNGKYMPGEKFIF
jgi:5S rRNA maturation endonuclease (ribonuclease M5)